MEQKTEKNSEAKKEGKEELTRQLRERILKSVEKNEKAMEKGKPPVGRKEESIKISNTKLGIENVELLKRAIKADSVRIKNQTDREAEARRIKNETRKKAERKMNREFRKYGVKGRIASKIASHVMSEAAYAIAAKLSEKATQGKFWGIIVFFITICIALVVDLLDIFGDAIAAVLVETAMGTVAVEVLLWCIGFFLSMVILMFWILLAGGSHNKFFWKLFLRYVVFVFLIDSIPLLQMFPFSTFIVLWNWYDFRKEKKKAKKELKAFLESYAKTGKIKNQYANYVAGVQY